MLVAMAIIVVAVVMGWRQPSVTDRLLDAVAWLIAGLTYLIIGQVFAGLIGLVTLLEPNAVTNLEPLNNNFVGNLIYFSFVTLTTTGYGDIVPIHPYARSLANIEAVIGQLLSGNVTRPIGNS
jgi:amino acid transporter